jgi:hypothetical protein
MLLARRNVMKVGILDAGYSMLLARRNVMKVGILDTGCLVVFVCM